MITDQKDEGIRGCQRNIATFSQYLDMAHLPSCKCLLVLSQVRIYYEAVSQQKGMLVLKVSHFDSLCLKAQSARQKVQRILSVKASM